MTDRQPISKRLRFEIFKRDEFTCAYCGAHPPDALLEVDHIHPVVAGGENDQDNLVTACFDCNRGKGAKLLTSVPQSLADKANETAEREAQIRAYYEILQAKKDRKEDELWAVADIYMERFSDDSILRSRLASIRMFLDRLDYFTVIEAMELATNKMHSKAPAFRYFCGVCWRRIIGHGGSE
ncbi:HNH endonuclease [Aminobacter anthyllidis]|uniref:HNH endonuclease n=1 Tax=Aminobacter anthyllidis TaxID=1035067 RepID=A0A9X1A6V6_9HYPH|nr:HNH endonuclease [Aminobacter anthyllidis]MBT1154344.1 HNH endonuclease [Aminobacter anthyllidis]